MQKVMNSSTLSIKKAFSINKTEDLEKAVNLVLNSKKLMFFGMGGSSTIALDAYTEFLRIGTACEYTADSYLQVMQAALSKPDDVIFAFSASGSNKDLIESVKTGKKNGAKIITITSNKESPLQLISDVVLTSYGKETILRSDAMESTITSLALIDCLFVGVALRRLDTTLANLDKIRAGIAVKRY